MRERCDIVDTLDREEARKIYGVGNAISEENDGLIQVSADFPMAVGAQVRRVGPRTRCGGVVCARFGLRTGDGLAHQERDGRCRVRRRRQHRRDGTHGEQDAHGGAQAELRRRQSYRRRGRHRRHLRRSSGAGRVHPVLRCLAANRHRAASSEGELRSKKGFCPGQHLRYRTVHPRYQLVDSRPRRLPNSSPTRRRARSTTDPAAPAPSPISLPRCWSPARVWTPCTSRSAAAGR